MPFKRILEGVRRRPLTVTSGPHASDLALLFGLRYGAKRAQKWGRRPTGAAPFLAADQFTTSDSAGDHGSTNNDDGGGSDSIELKCERQSQWRLFRRALPARQ